MRRAATTDDMRMPDPRQRLCLREKARTRPARQRNRWRQDLQRDQAAGDSSLAGEVNGAHRTATDLTDDLVVCNRWRRCGWIRGDDPGDP